MIKKISNTLKWLPYYAVGGIKKNVKWSGFRTRHVYFCICDHFEPYWNKASSAVARKRIRRWLEEYPKIADQFVDSKGRVLKYSFFYPEEEYKYEDLSELAKLCHSGYGEVEIHLHHDNDTSDNLRKTLRQFKKRLYEEHGLLSVDKQNNDISYGFIHGNWALDNSHPEGRWCGVNDEISILLETGCYADFTMPSAPHGTQTRKVNSLYYAVDDPQKPKSHDRGLDVEVGDQGNGMLMVQGPLGLNWKSRKFFCLPRIENGGIYGNSILTRERVRTWLDARIGVVGAPEHVFIKLYTHGTQEDIMRLFFDNDGFVQLFNSLQSVCDDEKMSLHFVSAREMVNLVLALRDNNDTEMHDRYDYRYVRASQVPAR